jgi:hypothetical protein
MILPIRAYGDTVLRKKAHDISPDYPELKELIDNMFETMNAAHGIGLAAPQIGLDIRLFIVDVTPLADDEDYEDIADELQDFKKVFINARILEESGNEWKFNEDGKEVIETAKLIEQYYKCIESGDIKVVLIGKINITGYRHLELIYVTMDLEHHEEDHCIPILTKF